MFLCINVSELKKNITPVVLLLHKHNFFEPIPLTYLKFITALTLCCRRGIICIIQCKVLVMLGYATSNGHPNDRYTEIQINISENCSIFNCFSRNVLL